MKNNKRGSFLPVESLFRFSLRYFLFAILATVVLSGCGSGGDGGGSSNETSGGGSDTTTTMAVIASGTVGPNGGTIADSSSETAVVIPPGAVTTTTTIQILRGRDASGNVVTSFTATPPTSGQVQLVLPDEDVLEASTPQNPGATTQNVQGISSSSLVAAATSASGVASDYPDRMWRQTKSNFWASHADFGAVGIGNRIDDRDVISALSDVPGLVTYESQTASKLLSIWYESERSGYEGKEAVLFVHGYLTQGAAILDGGLGGGQDTWGQFPKVLKDAGYVPFEFRWNTAARFEDVAQDLCQAVDLIAESTGKQVHIIAHSFGGILTRVYLQGLASGKCKYKGNVASVTTIGSPHSGIFDGPTLRNGIEFNVGQDTQTFTEARYVTGSLLIDSCLQLSCYQMGENVDFVKLNSLLISEENAKAVFRVEPMPGEIAAKIANTSTNPLHPIPIQVLIGLTTSRDDITVLDAGDGLISYQGQRFSPEYASLMSDTLIGSAHVTERILGFGPHDDVRPGYYNSLTPGAENYGGYRHSGLPVGPSDAIRMANIGCDLRNDLGLVDVPNCASGGFGHPSLSYAYSWITNHVAGLATSGPKFILRVRIQDAITNVPVVDASVKVKSSGYDLGGPSPTGQDGYVNISTRFLAGVAYDLVVTKAGYRAEEFPAVLVTGDSQGDIEIPSKVLTPEAGTAVAPPPQFASLKIVMNGTGSGSVTGNGIACPADCSTTGKTGATIVLTSKADAGSSFNGWIGCTSTQADYCYVTLDADKAVTASFAKTASTSSSITVGPTLLNFDNVPVGTCKTYPFVIQHVAGTDPASGTVSVSSNTVFNIASGNSFSVSNGTAAFVDVRFCPSSSSAYTGAATVTSSAIFTGTNSVTLSGTGTPPSTTPDLQVLNGSVVSSSGFVTASWTLANQGTGTANASTTVVRINQSSTSAAGSNLASISTPSLAAGASQPQNTTLTAPTTAGTYYVWVLADNYSTSGQSASAAANDIVLIGSFTVAGTPPAAFTLTGSAQCSGTSPQIVLSGWGSSGATSFDVYRNGSLYSSANTGSTFTNTSVTAGTTYSYYVVAKNTSGSTTSNTVSVTAPTCSGTVLTPTAPGGLVALAASSFMSLAWNDNSSNETGFMVERKTGASGSWSQIASVGQNIAAYLDYGVSAGVTYYYRVYAYNASGNSSYSNEAFATIAAVSKEVTVANLSGGLLMLRSGPGQTYSIITTLPEGTKMSVIGGPTLADGYTWWNISGANGTGWSAVGEWLSPPPQTGATVTVSYTGGAGLKLRSTASLSGTILTTLPEGTQVNVFSGPIQANGYTWWAVQGYVGGTQYTGWSAVGDWLTPNPRY